MKASSPATLLKFSFGVLMALLGAAVATAQPASYVPPAGSGLGPPGAVQKPIYRAPTYTPPRTTAVPTYNQPTARAPATTKKPATASAPPPPVKPVYPQYAPPPPGYRPQQQPYFPPTVKPPATTKPRSSTPSLESKVSKLEKNDRHQDLRLSNLERDVGRLPETIEGGGLSAPVGHMYVVRPGDTLWHIADRHNTSINALRSANRLTADTVSVGQTLLIPGDDHPGSGPVTGNVHIVKPGDTFYQIAATYKVSQDALAKANPTVYPDKLLIGERIVIPGKKQTASAVPDYLQPAGGGRPVSHPTTTTTTTRSLTHTVKKGESLGVIAKKYGISTSSLASANKQLKNPNIVEIGQKLTIPGKKVTTTVSAPNYASAPPLYVDPPQMPSMAPSYNSTPPADTMTPYPAAPPPLPPITPPPAPMAAAPKIPPASASASASRGVVAYRLERGDSIETVANMFGTTADKIRELNKLSPEKVLKDGDEVVVPALGAVSVN